MNNLEINSIKLGIVGYRKFNDYKKFKQLVDDYIKEIGIPVLIVSGGAKGVDTMAEQYAKEHNIQTQIFLPDWDTYGKKAGIMRNTDIVNASTHILALPDAKKSIGTFDSINKAKILKKNLKVVNI
jgi:hypothetical protein